MSRDWFRTGQDGTILERTILGDSLLIPGTHVGTDKDQNRVFYFDVQVRKKQPQEKNKDKTDR